jgi:hypothetical protein
MYLHRDSCSRIHSADLLSLSRTVCFASHACIIEFAAWASPLPTTVVAWIPRFDLSVCTWTGASTASGFYSVYNIWIGPGLQNPSNEAHGMEDPFKYARESQGWWRQPARLDPTIRSSSSVETHSTHTSKSYFSPFSIRRRLPLRYSLVHIIIT